MCIWSWVAITFDDKARFSISSDDSVREDSDRRAIEATQSMRVFGEVGRDPVDDHADAGTVQAEAIWRVWGVRAACYDRWTARDVAAFPDRYQGSSEPESHPLGHA